MKKYLAVYQATTRRASGIQVSTGSIDVMCKVLNMATIRAWEARIQEVAHADGVVITNVIPLEG